MEDTPNVWPPKPEFSTKSPYMCPACLRRLLTQTSALCNWCGAPLDDPVYLEQAAQARQVNDEALREKHAAAAAREAKQKTLLGVPKRNRIIRPRLPLEADGNSQV